MKLKYIYITCFVLIMAFALVSCKDIASAAEIVAVDGTYEINVFDDSLGVDILRKLGWDGIANVADFINGLRRDAIEWAVAQFVATDSLTFDDIVERIIADPERATYDLHYIIDTSTEVRPVRVGFRDTFYDGVKKNTDTLFNDESSAVPSGWVQLSSNPFYGNYIDSNRYYYTSDESVYYRVYVANSSGQLSAVFCTLNNNNAVFNLYAPYLPQYTTNQILDGQYHYVSLGDGTVPSNFRPRQDPVSYVVNVRDILVREFYGNVGGSGETVPNGNGYILPYNHILNRDVDLKTINNYNSQDISNYYYNIYGDTYESGDINYFNYYITNNAIDYNYNYDVPYWLVNGDYSIKEYPQLDYTIPSVDVLPDIPQINTSFIQDVYNMIPPTITAVFVFMFMFGIVLLIIK